MHVYIDLSILTSFLFLYGSKPCIEHLFHIIRILFCTGLLYSIYGITPSVPHIYRPQNAIHNLTGSSLVLFSNQI